MAVFRFQEEGQAPRPAIEKKTVNRLLYEKDKEIFFLERRIRELKKEKAQCILWGIASTSVAIFLGLVI